MDNRDDHPLHLEDCWELIDELTESLVATERALAQARQKRDQATAALRRQFGLIRRAHADAWTEEEPNRLFDDYPILYELWTECLLGLGPQRIQRTGDEE